MEGNKTHKKARSNSKKRAASPTELEEEEPKTSKVSLYELLQVEKTASIADIVPPLLSPLIS
jgi:hypothetical protein